MRNEHNTDANRQTGQQTQPGKQAQQNKSDGNRQPGQQSQQDKSDNKRHAGQQSQQGKSAGGYGSREDRENKEQEGKGKIATSNADGERSHSKRL
jgi:hypothetical protein